MLDTFSLELTQVKWEGARELWWYCRQRRALYREFLFSHHSCRSRSCGVCLKRRAICCAERERANWVLQCLCAHASISFQSVWFLIYWIKLSTRDRLRPVPPCMVLLCVMLSCDVVFTQTRLLWLLGQFPQVTGLVTVICMIVVHIHNVCWVVSRTRMNWLSTP